MLRSFFLIAVTAVTIGSTGGLALAQSSTQQGYDETGVLGQVDNNNTGGPGVLGDKTVHATPTTAQPAAVATPTPAATTNGSSLPFTGMDVGIVLLLGLVLVGTGFVVRRAGRRSGADA